MTRKRTRLELFIDILNELDSGVDKPTNLMYKCNMSWRPLQEIFKSMVEQGLIKEIGHNKRKIYQITEKGIDTLKFIRRANQLVTVR